MKILEIPVVTFTKLNNLSFDFDVVVKCGDRLLALLPVPKQNNGPLLKILIIKKHLLD